MDIGTRIKQARKEANITQEKVAEVLGVSRQTISNWENEKSYPDILSVLKMSDLYNVSLDYLLKGEVTMNGYLNYLDESTNTVKSRAKLSKLILLMSYLVIWAIAIIVFWIFAIKEPDGAMGYSLMFLWVILPVTTLVISYFIGRNNYGKKRKWASSIGFGIMYMLSEYATFSMANNLSFNKINLPEFSMLWKGIAISLIGIALGHLVFTKSRTKQN